MITFNSSLFNVNNFRTDHKNKANQLSGSLKFGAKEKDTQPSSRIILNLPSRPANHNRDTYTRTSPEAEKAAVSLDISKYYDEDWVPCSNQQAEEDRLKDWKRKQLGKA